MVVGGNDAIRVQALGRGGVKTPEELSPGFPEWPQRWRGVEDDVDYGQGLVDIVRSFVVHLIAKRLTEERIRRHLGYLWFLGGEAIRKVSEDDQYDVSRLAELLDCVDSGGGP